jgi:Domain of unknown function (DUF4837)
LKRIFDFSIIILMLLAANSCKNYSTAMGSERQIYVFADSLLWKQVQPLVEERFHSFVYTPRAERSFFVTWKPLRDLNSLQERLNIVFIGTTQDKNQVNDYLQQMIPQEFINDVNNDKSFYFFKDNLFLQDQISLFMIAKNAASFKQIFPNLEKDIYNRFEEKYFARLRQRMFKNGEQLDLEEFLESEFGYKVRVQHDYFVANQNPDEKYVWLRRVDPNRWISIWKVNRDSSVFSQDSLIKIRNTMTDKYYDGDHVNNDETSLETSKLAGKDVLKLVGTWTNDSLVVGGPFRMYVLPNEREKCLYMLDIAVMAPTKDKKPFLDQLEVIAQTFTFSDKNQKK